MKLLHLSDLHIGKRVNEISMIEDQKYILTKIINIVDEEKPDGIIIAGDVYDRSVPSEEAMLLWDDFLGRIAKRDIPVYAISGNHDSAVRFSDHSRLIKGMGIHFSPVYDGNVEMVKAKDEYGPVNIYLLPFVKPVNVKAVFPDEEIKDYTDACRVAIDHMNVDEAQRNILVAHQFVTGAQTCESEEVMVGGLDNVDASVFDAFDYVALGHIHGPQHIKRETVRYCGTPLKYSFSEKSHKKSVTIIEMGEKGSVGVRTAALVPQHDLREIKGSFDELTSKEYYDNTERNDYLHIILTDEDDVFEAVGKLKVIYPNLMKLSYDNTRTRQKREIGDAMDVDNRSPLDLFEELFVMQNNQPMSKEQKNFVSRLIESIWEV